MMVLIDTSIWIRFLHNKSPYAQEVDRLLHDEEVLGHDLVLGELLIGSPGGRRKLLSSYILMPQAPTVPHGEVVTFVQQRSLFGRGIGWIDAHLLASSLTVGCRLWTADESLSGIARALGVSH